MSQARIAATLLLVLIVVSFLTSSNHHNIIVEAALVGNESTSTTVPPTTTAAPSQNTCGSLTFQNGTVLNFDNASLFTGSFKNMLQHGGAASGTTHDFDMSLCTPSSFDGLCTTFEYITQGAACRGSDFTFSEPSILISQYGDNGVEFFYKMTDGPKTYQAQLIVYCSENDAAAQHHLVSPSNTYTVNENGDQITITWILNSGAVCVNKNGPSPPTTTSLPSTCEPVTFPNSSKLELYPSYFTGDFNNMKQMMGDVEQANETWTMSLCSPEAFKRSVPEINQNVNCTSPEYLAEGDCSATHNKFPDAPLISSPYGDNGIQLIYQTKDVKTDKTLQALMIIQCNWDFMTLSSQVSNNSYIIDETASKITYTFTLQSRGACIGAPDPSIPTTPAPINNCGTLNFPNGSSVVFDPSLFRADLGKMMQTGFSSSEHVWSMSLCAPELLHDVHCHFPVYLAEDQCNSTTFPNEAQLISFYQDNAVQFLFQTTGSGLTIKVQIFVTCSPSSDALNSPVNSYSATVNDQTINYRFDLQSKGACVTHGGPSTEAPTQGPTTETNTTTVLPPPPPNENTTTAEPGPPAPACPSVTFENQSIMHFDASALTADFIDVQQTGLGTGTYTWHFSLCEKSTFNAVCPKPEYLAQNSDCSYPFSQDPTTAALPDGNGFVFTYSQTQPGIGLWITTVNCVCSATPTTGLLLPTNQYEVSGGPNSEILLKFDVEAQGCCLHSSGPAPTPPSPTAPPAPPTPPPSGAGDCPATVSFPNGSSVTFDAANFVGDFPQMDQLNLAPAKYDWRMSLCSSDTFGGLCLSPEYLAQGGSCDQATFGEKPTVTANDDGTGLKFVYNRQDTSGNPWIATVIVVCDPGATSLSSPSNSYSAGQQGTTITLDWVLTSAGACVSGNPPGPPPPTPGPGPAPPTPAPPATTKCPNVLFPNGTLVVVDNEFLVNDLIKDMQQTGLAPGTHDFSFSLCELSDFNGVCDPKNKVFLGQSECEQATFVNSPTTAPNADNTGITFTYNQVDSGNNSWIATVNCKCGSSTKLNSPSNSYVASLDAQSRILLDFEMESLGCCYYSGSNHRHHGAPDSGNGNGDGGDKVLTWGAIFLMSFLIPVFLYIVITMIYNYRNDKRLAPHPEFWGNIWGLFKDGVSFLWSKIRGTEWSSSSDNTEYEALGSNRKGGGYGYTKAEV